VVALSRLFPVLRRVEALAGAHARALEIPTSGIAAASGRGAARSAVAAGGQSPLVLVIDDLQWGDVDSASVLAELVRPPDPPHSC
jgi:hypothetical protein